MAHEFAVNDKFENGGSEGVGDEDNQAGRAVNAESKEKHGGEGKETVGEHIVFDGVTAVFGCFVLGEGPASGSGTIESVGDFANHKDEKAGVNGGVGECHDNERERESDARESKEIGQEIERGKLGGGALRRFAGGARC